jgi:DNA primase
MPGGFTQQHLDEIRSRVDIVEIVGQVVKLKRAGENWKGLCPFHTEKTASFTVNPKRNIYHCFGCGAASPSARASRCPKPAGGAPRPTTSSRPCAG